ncbi:hypothetical protein GPA10_37000 [Streptomyces sp. p1417]|uniref:Uncharacterized protein n=1 Tax=Streptomyces typhae TaxID=2681492 RepID=A0A6L6X8G7_9ACTN|nr:hypothetical protein [Streptomyces typhae]MVO90205.1 hypothetical protein [Streptomyces typhae]
MKPPQFVIRYAVGLQEREAVVVANGHSLADYVDRLEEAMEQALTTEPPSTPFLAWSLAAGGAVVIRIDSIIALEASGV